MRLLLFVVMAFSIIACSKDNDNDVDVPTPAIDTLKSGWKKIQVSTTDQINDIFFINSTTGYAISRNSIFRSTDGGNHWSQVYQSDKLLYNIAMGNENNALVTSASKVVLFTNNGGLSFDSISLADNSIDDAFFVGESIAYAIGEKIWKTIDAGKSWTPLSAISADPNHEIGALYFLDEQTGWVTGTGFFKTKNGGATWNNVSVSNPDFGQTGNIFFSNPSTGYITSPTSIYKTSDGGTSFTKISDMHNRGGYHDIHFVDSQTGYITDRQYILKTIDAGQTWTKEVILAQGELIELHFTDASHGWAGGSSGLILKYER